MMRILRLMPRLVVALALAPLLYRLVVIYLASQQGGTAEDLMHASLDALRQIYLTFTLPALAILMLVVWPGERLMRLLGLDLLSIVTSPPLAWVGAFVLARLIGEQRVPGAADMTGLAVVYGVVWALTIREMPPPSRRKTKAAVNPEASAEAPATADATAAANLAAVEPNPPPTTDAQVEAIVARNLRAAAPAEVESPVSEETPLPETTEDEVGEVIAENADEAAPPPKSDASKARLKQRARRRERQRAGRDKQGSSKTT